MLPRPQDFSYGSRIGAASKRSGLVYKPRSGWRLKNRSHPKT